jgi:hypothetical protein
MLKNKSLVLLLVLFGHITTYNTLQSKQRNRPAQPVQLQVQPPVLVPQPVVLPAQPRIQQPVQRRQVRRQPTPRRQINRRASPRQVRRPIQQQAPVQQPVVVPQPIQQPIPVQPVVVPQPIVPPIQQPAPVPATAPQLSKFDFNAASVLPTFINQNGKKYLIISRERGGSDKGTYDDFGGKRDYIGPQTKEAHPVITAAREYFEEAILSLSIGMSLPDTKKFIDVDNAYTEYVIANGQVKYAIYITDFTQYANTFFANYYHAFNTTKSRHSREKDRIAIIEWDTLKTIVNNAPFNTGIMVDAQVLNPLDNKWYTEKVTLRPIFVKKLRPFWMDKPYQQGINSKIRFY